MACTEEAKSYKSQEVCNERKTNFVEKKPDYAVKAGELREELVSYLGITGVKSVRVLIRYDIENLSEDTYKKALGTTFLRAACR